MTTLKYSDFIWSVAIADGLSLFGGLDSGLDYGTGLTANCAHHFEASNTTRILTSHDLNSRQPTLTPYLN